MNETADKSALRRKFSALRNALTAEMRREKDVAVCRSIAALPVFQRAEAVAGFIRFGAEVDLTLLFRGKRLLLPRFSAAAMEYELVEVNDIELDLLPGKYGILEPKPELPAVSRDFVTSSVLFLTPAVACDRRGVRLGRGGGYYDRLLAGVKLPPVAAIYACQLSETPLPADVHDITMGTIVTESEVIAVRENNLTGETEV